MVAEKKNLMQQFFELLINGPSPDEVLAFKVSDEDQDRITFLLEKNSSGLISFEEQYELHRFVELEHMITTAKVRAINKMKMRGN